MSKHNWAYELTPAAWRELNNLVKKHKKDEISSFFVVLERLVRAQNSLNEGVSIKATNSDLLRERRQHPCGLLGARWRRKG
jgi:hypothetical protein